MIFRFYFILILTDPSTTKLLLSGIHCPNICVLFLQHHLLKPTTLSSHCLLLNSTNNWKPTFSFNPILLRLSPFRTDTLELDSAWFTRHSHSISFFIHQHIIHRVAIFFIHDVVSVPEKADRNSFLSALWCTLNLPHSLTLLISPHFITCFVNHS